MVLLRPVPGTSPIHELWAGTKLIVVALIGIVLTIYPGWVPIGLVALLVMLTAWLAHIPRSVLPSVPRLVWVLLLLGGGTAALAGGDGRDSGHESSAEEKNVSSTAVHRTFCFFFPILRVGRHEGLGTQQIGSLSVLASSVPLATR